MSWSALNAKQLVSGKDLIDAVNSGIFTVKSGQTIPNTDQILERSQALTLVNIQAISNTKQLVSKEELVPVVVAPTSYYQFTKFWNTYPTDDTGYPSGSEDEKDVVCDIFSEIEEPLYITRSSGKIQLGDVVYRKVGNNYVPLIQSLTSLVRFRDPVAQYAMRLNSSGAAVWIKPCTIIKRGNIFRRKHIYNSANGNYRLQIYADNPVASQITVYIKGGTIQFGSEPTIGPDFTVTFPYGEKSIIVNLPNPEYNQNRINDISTYEDEFYYYDFINVTGE